MQRPLRRSSFFDARTHYDQGRIPNFPRNDFGGALGGPLRQNKLFLFGNYEGYRQNLGVTEVTFAPDNDARAGCLPNAAGVKTPVTLGAGAAGLLNIWPVQNGPELLDAKGNRTGIGLAYSNPAQHIREDFGTARFDANLTANDLLFAGSAPRERAVASRNSSISRNLYSVSPCSSGNGIAPGKRPSAQAAA